jgi:hypothetical protein
MNGKLHIDSPALMREIARYLAVIDAFRDELCEPTWHAELAPSGTAEAGRAGSRKARGRTSRKNRG